MYVKPNGGPRWHEHLETIKQAYEQGISYEEMATMHNLTNNEVCGAVKYLFRLGRLTKQRNKRKRRSHLIDYSLAKELREKGWSYSRIARKLKCTPSGVWGCLKQHASKNNKTEVKTTEQKGDGNETLEAISNAYKQGWNDGWEAKEKVKML